MAGHTLAEYVLAVNYSYGQCFLTPDSSAIYIIVKGFTWKGLLDKIISIMVISALLILVFSIVILTYSGWRFWDSVLFAGYFLLIYGLVPICIIAIVWEKITGVKSYFFTQSELDSLLLHMRSRAEE